MTTANNLISIGLVSCLLALAIQVFPGAAWRIGADPGASWLLIATGGRGRRS